MDGLDGDGPDGLRTAKRCRRATSAGRGHRECAGRCWRDHRSCVVGREPETARVVPDPMNAHGAHRSHAAHRSRRRASRASQAHRSRLRASRASQARRAPRLLIPTTTPPRARARGGGVAVVPDGVRMRRFSGGDVARGPRDQACRSRRGPCRERRMAPRSQGRSSCCRDRSRCRSPRFDCCEAGSRRCRPIVSPPRPMRRRCSRHCPVNEA